MDTPGTQSSLPWWGGGCFHTRTSQCSYDCFRKCKILPTSQHSRGGWVVKTFDCITWGCWFVKLPPAWTFQCKHMDMSKCLDLQTKQSHWSTYKGVSCFPIFADFKIGLICRVLNSQSDNVYVPWGNVDSMCNIIYQ